MIMPVGERAASSDAGPRPASTRLRRPIRTPDDPRPAIGREDGKFELLKGHHQDKTKPGYHDRKTDRWVGQVFRKYLFINAYTLRKDGLALSNHLSKRFPKILPFTDDPFDVARDKAFLDYNQFKLPHEYHFERKPTLIQPVGSARPGPHQDRSTAPA